MPDASPQRLEIVPYDHRWVLEFEAERERITNALGRLARRIDHHGSTAVPNLAAKATIDIQVSVDGLQPLSAYSNRLATLGYTHVVHPDDAVCPFFHRPAVWPHTHHVHVVEAGGEQERRTLAFRDYLRDHDEAAQKYAELKLELAAHSDAMDPASREAYARAKSVFVGRIVGVALAAGYPRWV